MPFRSILRSTMVWLIFFAHIGAATTNAQEKAEPSSPYLPSEMATLPEPPDFMPDVLQRLGVPEPRAEKQAHARARSSSYDYTPYGAFANGAEGYAIAHSGGVLPGMQYLPRGWISWNPFSHRAQSLDELNPLVVSTGLKSYDSSMDMALSVLNGATPGGNWNQFYGQQPQTAGWQASLPNHDPTYTGGGYEQNDPLLQALFGYDLSAPTTYSTDFLLYVNELVSPSTVLNYDSGFGFGKRAMAGKQQTALAKLEDRYAELGRRQMDYYYSDETLSSLRQEATEVLLYALYTDPYYMYYSYWLNTTLGQIYTSRPSYSQVVQLAQEMATWTDPPQSKQVLEERYLKRLWFSYYNAVVEYEVMAYLLSDAATWRSVQEVAAWLGQRAFANWSKSLVELWYADWVQRFEAAYDASGTLAETVDGILEDFPAFEEYLTLNQHVVELTEALADRPAVQTATRAFEEVLADRDVARSVHQEYEAYRTQMGSLLQDTDFVAELEGYYERLNGLLMEDEVYVLLQVAQYLDVLQLQDYQQRVYEAVGECLYYYGDGCSAYAYPSVRALIESPSLLLIVKNTADFYEAYHRFWHDFYTSAAYSDLEASSTESMQQALAAVAPEIDAARAAYRHRVERIPRLSSLHETMDDMVESLLDVPLREATGKRTTHATLGQMLDRMATLKAELEGTDVAREEEPPMPRRFALEGNYPNPFNPSTTIRYELPEATHATLKVYDLLGRDVATLVDGPQAAGAHEISFEAGTLPSGVYLYRLETATYTATRKLIVQR